MSNFYNKLKFPALFSVLAQARWEKSAGDFNLLYVEIAHKAFFCFDFPLPGDAL